MKKIILLIIGMLAAIFAFAQEPEEAFDFWVGNWDLTWTGQDGKEGKGTNRIVKILDGKVIEENFEDLNSGFKGKSISVYNPRFKTWHQAWADNQGGYFDFKGVTEGDSRMFQTKMVEKDGKKIIQRMRFYNITADSLTWDWEMTTDGGETWSLQWRINYKRAD